jgi:hypothetical protein
VTRSLLSAIMLGTLSLLLIAAPLAFPSFVPNALGHRVEDFGAYWCAARVAREGGNPYDASQLKPLEAQIDPTRNDPLITWSPPWAVSLVIPHSGFPFPAARVSWMIFQLLALAGCGAVLWRRYGGSEDRIGVAWLVTFSFYPTLQLIGLGQMSLFALAGIVGFLEWHKRFPILAGACLALTFVKPHNVIPFGVAVMVWVVWSRQWKIVIGGISALTLWTLAALAVNPSFFSHYRDTMSANPPGMMMPPTVGTLLRLAFHADQSLWIQFIPTAIGAVWAAGYAIRNREQWYWPDAAQPLLFASVLCSPYGWIYDAVILLVPILAVSAHGLKRPILWLVGYFVLTGVGLANFAWGGEEVNLVWLPWVLLAGWWVNRKSNPVHPPASITP